MVQKIKNNYLFFISIFISLIFMIIPIINFMNWNEQRVESEQKAWEFCLSMGDNIDPNYEEYCAIAKKNVELKMDFFSMITTTISGDFALGVVGFLFLFLAIPSLFYICKYLKNNMIAMEIQRRSYQKIKFRLFFEAYKSVLILPFVVAVGFLLCFLYTKTFDPSYALFASSMLWDEQTVSNPGLFISCYLLVLVMYSFLYVNICLCVARKQHNYFLAVILSYLIFLGIEAILEVLFNVILFSNILHSNLGIMFNIMSIFTYKTHVSFFCPLIMAFIFMALSFIAVYFAYRKQESLIMDCELEKS